MGRAASSLPPGLLKCHVSLTPLHLALLFLTEFMNFLSTDFFTLNGSSVGQPLVSPVQPRVLRPSREPDPWEVLSTQQILRWTKE